MKRALLARPSSLIVENMRRFMTTLGLEPTRLNTADELHQYEADEVGCIVISTALSSTVKESYCEIVKKVRSTFPGKPIFIASFADIKRSKVIVRSKFKSGDCDIELLCMEEAARQVPLDFAAFCVLITNDEIKSDPALSESVKRFQSLFTIPV
ncbi:MAG: hypothetical protein AAGA85_02090 [Bacteroidota bacterium]